MLLGRAFQIRDDILGIFGEEKDTGKSNLTDIKEAKRTLLAWYAFNHANKKDRLMLASTIVAKAIDYGIKPEDLFLDPILIPVNVAQAQCKEVLESIREFRLLCDPAPNTTVGLSNVSQGTKFRPLVNRTFLIMAIANGLTSAILDPLDKELMDAMITAELILNKSIYCDSFLEAYRKR